MSCDGCNLLSLFTNKPNYSTAVGLEPMLAFGHLMMLESPLVQKSTSGFVNDSLAIALAFSHSVC
jgi:hypothetical protein